MGSPMAAPATAAENRDRKSSWTDSSTITVPSEVHRCPAVPNPLNRAPSTARSRSASGMTTRGFFPPSSRQGDWKCRPHSSPIRRPTSVEPVNPTLSTSPSSMARSNPVNAVGPSASTMLKTPSGNPAWRISWANASAVAGVYSAGFHTTAFPHSSAGTMYQDGTATGKFPAVMITETPTGARNVNSCLSGSSDGTVCPYSRRPSERKKAHVSTTSCTSPSDSVNGLPISRVSSVARARLFSSTRRPSCWTARPRTGAGTCAHASCARRAVRQASTNVGASARDASATTSSRCAGFGTVIWPPGAPSTPLPPISDDTVLVMTGTSRPARRGRPTASSARAAPSPTPSWPVPASARTARPLELQRGGDVVGGQLEGHGVPVRAGEHLVPDLQHGHAEHLGPLRPSLDEALGHPVELRPGLFADLRHLHRSMVGPTAAATNRPARSRPTAFRDHRRTLWLRQADRCFQEMRTDDAPDPGRRRRGGRVAGARGAGAASARPRALRRRPPVRLPRVPGDGAERAAALRPGEPRPQPPGKTRRAGLATEHLTEGRPRSRRAARVHERGRADRGRGRHLGGRPRWEHQVSGGTEPVHPEGDASSGAPVAAPGSGSRTPRPPRRRRAAHPRSSARGWRRG